MRFFRILVFLLPVQLGLHFWPNWAYIFGIRVDYFAPTFYLTDILVAIFIASVLLNKRRQLLTFFLKNKQTVFLVLGWALLNILVAEVPTLAIVKWLKVFELVLFAIATASASFDLKKDVINPLSFSLIAISMIGIFQFVKGGSLGGSLYFLGERTFNQTTVGIALAELFGREYVRSYSIFSHPNSFAGYLVVGLVMLLFTKTSERQFWIKISAVCLSLLALVLAFSTSAFIAAIGVVICYYFLKLQKDRSLIYLLLFMLILLSLLLPLISSYVLVNYEQIVLGQRDVFERLWLNSAAGELFTRSPLFGIGLNNFIVLVTKTAVPSVVVWRLQPVHNIFLLILVETGIFGILLFWYLLFKTHRNSKFIIPILVILITGLLDHYWFTLQQNQLLFSLVLGLSFNKYFQKI